MNSLNFILQLSQILDVVIYKPIKEIIENIDIIANSNIKKNQK